MTEPVVTEIKKLSDIAIDMDLSSSLRSNAIKSLGNIGTREALLALLDLAANEKLNPGERKMALKQAEKIIR